VSLSIIIIIIIIINIIYIIIIHMDIHSVDISRLWRLQQVEGDENIKNVDG